MFWFCLSYADVLELIHLVELRKKAATLDGDKVLPLQLEELHSKLKFQLLSQEGNPLKAQPPQTL